MKSYVRNRGVYAAQVLPQLGLTMADMNKLKDMCASQIKELTNMSVKGEHSSIVPKGNKCLDFVRHVDIGHLLGYGWTPGLGQEDLPLVDTARGFRSEIWGTLV